MNKTIETKWKYISRRCKEMGYDAPGKTALLIDHIIAEMGYPKYTNQWIEDYPHEMDNKSISDVVYCCMWCTPCVVEGGGKPNRKICDRCKFNLEGGYILYDRFADELDECLREDMEKIRAIWEKIDR